MAKLTKKQVMQYDKLVELLHAMIISKHSNKRSDYEDIIAKIREAVKEDEKNDSKG